MFAFWNKSKSVNIKQDIIISNDLYHLEGVNIEFPLNKALHNVQLTVHKQDFIFLTGSSGAGKTTLLRTLAGEICPSSGRIFSPLFDGSNDFFVASVFQDLRLSPFKTCEENLWTSFDKKLYGSKKQFIKEMHEFMEIFSVSKFKDLKICHANGGLKQKVAIIRALLTRPAVLLADEPTSALDSVNATRLYEVLSYLNKNRGTTIIWATHNRDLVRKFVGRIIHLDNGKLIHSGNACFI